MTWRVTGKQLETFRRTMGTLNRRSLCVSYQGVTFQKTSNFSKTPRGTETYEHFSERSCLKGNKGRTWDMLLYRVN